MASKSQPKDRELKIVPANKASWEDLEAVLGKATHYESQCYCQRFKIPTPFWRGVGDEQRAEILREQSQCDHPRARRTSGLVAYLGDEAVGWCAVEPRVAYLRLLAMQMPWLGREDEDKGDEGVWAITCFIVRTGYRNQGITYALARAAVEYAQAQGAVAVEGYAMETHAGKTITWGELHVGAKKVFEAAGLKEITHPSKRRFVMRRDF
jgi:GNAT superfamily N-acetyltransferase